MKNGILKEVLRLARRGGSDVNFGECANERNRMEGVTDLYHRETVGKFHDEMWADITSSSTLWLKSSTAFPNYKRMIKNEEIPRESGVSPRIPRLVSRRRTDHEIRDTDQRRDPSDHGSVERGV